jgi:hypothetical protein
LSHFLVVAAGLIVGTQNALRALPIELSIGSTAKPLQTESASPGADEADQEEEDPAGVGRLRGHGTTSATLSVEVVIGVALVAEARIAFGAFAGSFAGSFAVVWAGVRLYSWTIVETIADTLALGARVAICARIAIVALRAFAEFVLWARRVDAVAGFIEVTLVVRTATSFPSRNELIRAAFRYPIAEVRNIAGACRGATEGCVGGSFVGRALERSAIASVGLVTNAC